MGVIKRQSIKQSIVTYVAICVGVLNIVIYPATLSKEEIGFFKWCIEIATFLMPFLLLGSNALSIKYFPMFKNQEKGHNGFLFLMLLIPSISLLLFSVTSLIFENQLKAPYVEDYPEFVAYFPYIIPLIICVVYSSTFTTYSYNHQRIVVPAIFNDLFLKITIPVLAITYYFQFINFEGFIRGMVLSYFLTLIGLIFYVKYLDQLHLRPDFKLLKVPIRKEMGSYMSYTMFGGIGGVLAHRIDALMITFLLGYGYGGIYFLVLMIGNVIDVPRRAITNVAGPIVSKAWKENNMEEIKSLYLKTSLIQLIIGVFLLTGLWASIDEVFVILPKGDEYRSGKYVILILGFARVIDMATGINGQIINYSKYFRVSFYAVLLLAVINIVANIILIPIYLLNGAAIATLFSVIAFNLFKLSFIYYKLKIHPFRWSMLSVLLLGLGCYYLAKILPSTNYAILDLLIKSILITVLYGGAVLGFKFSTDINETVLQGWESFRKLTLSKRD